jgi:NADH:ubiquinone oxidoreductase subunit 6 (subunit J)
MPRFLVQNWPMLAASGLGLLAIFLLLPRPRRYSAVFGILAGILAIGLAGWALIRPEPVLVETILFYCFAGLAVLFGGMMITQTQPVRAALSFAMVILNTCGLFLLQAAPFLMAATIIVYAGAIVVTFLFVIMLAQQSGMDNADHRSREPLLACVAGFVLLGALLYVLRHDYRAADGNPELLAKVNEQLKDPETGKAPFASSMELSDEIGEYQKKIEPLLKADSPASLRTALGDVTWIDKFRNVVQPLKSPPNSPQNYKNQMVNHLTELNIEKLLDLDDDNKETAEKARREIQEHLKSLQILARRLQIEVQGLAWSEPDPKRTLSGFSGAKPNEPPVLDAHGRVKMPADNVAALGRSLFTDYLVGVELAATLLLVATIGAIVIAGRKGDGLK